MRRNLTTLFCSLLSLAALLGIQQPLAADTPVTVGGISFYLADGYSIKGRTQLTGGEAAMICPDDNPNNHRLVLKIYPNYLEGINGLTSEEVSDMLTDAVNSLAGVIAADDSGYKVDGNYGVLFEDDPDCPTAYTNFSGKDKKGTKFLLSAKAVLVHGALISGCAIASDKKALDELNYIFREVVGGDADVAQGGLDDYSVTVDGLTFDVFGHFSLVKREPLDPGESLTFVPDGSDSETLYLIVMPDVIPKTANPSDSRVTELLKNSTKKLADAVVSSFGLKKNYEIEYDNAGLTPIAFANLKGKTPEGAPFMCHTETTLAAGTVISCCAVAANDARLSEMVGVYEGAVGAALRR